MEARQLGDGRTVLGQAQGAGRHGHGAEPRGPVAERRAAIDARAAEIGAKPERQGRGGLEPVRYDDWEVKGLAVDF
ncbi:DUF1674 domain-containing protein [Methylobacterium radiotolerans]|uniref:DUF1674 domain-containing protein n=1 Tax=Methylobacterium radiotolerans TaxID=31998 RepID=UPI003AF8343F